jgi:hypothetical protein
MVRIDALLEPGGRLEAHVADENQDLATVLSVNTSLDQSPAHQLIDIFGERRSVKQRPFGEFAHRPAPFVRKHVQNAPVLLGEFRVVDGFTQPHAHAAMGGGQNVGQIFGEFLPGHSLKYSDSRLFYPRKSFG